MIEISSQGNGRRAAGALAGKLEIAELRAARAADLVAGHGAVESHVDLAERSGHACATADTVAGHLHVAQLRITGRRAHGPLPRLPGLLQVPGKFLRADRGVHRNLPLACYAHIRCSAS
jgi:hypothetical protein